MIVLELVAGAADAVLRRALTAVACGAFRAAVALPYAALGFAGATLDQLGVPGGRR